MRCRLCAGRSLPEAPGRHLPARENRGPCKKGDVGCDIRVPEPLIELDAVDNLNPVGIVNMIGSQIAVAVPNFPVFNAAFKQAPFSFQEGPGGAPNDADDFRIKKVDGKSV